MKSNIHYVIEVLKQRLVEAERKNIPFDFKVLTEGSIKTETKTLLREFFSKNENNDFSKISDKDIIEKLIRVGFSLNELNHFTYLFTCYLRHYPKLNGGLSPISQQIRDGIIELAGALKDSETKPYRQRYLAYYQPYFDYINYVYILRDQLKEGKLIVPENHVGKEVQAYCGILDHLEERFRDALASFDEGLDQKDASKFDEETGFGTQAYYSRAIHRRLLEIIIVQSWLNIYQSKADCINPSIPQSVLFKTMGQAIAYLVVTSKVVKEEAAEQSQNLGDGDQKPDSGYTLLRKRIKDALKFVLILVKELSEARKKAKRNEEFENNALGAFELACDFIKETAGFTRPEESVGATLEVVLEDFKEYADLAKVKSRLASVSPKIVEKLMKSVKTGPIENKDDKPTTKMASFFPYVTWELVKRSGFNETPKVTFDDGLCSIDLNTDTVEPQSRITCEDGTYSIERSIEPYSSVPQILLNNTGSTAKPEWRKHKQETPEPFQYSK